MWSFNLMIISRQSTMSMSFQGEHSEVQREPMLQLILHPCWHWKTMAHSEMKWILQWSSRYFNHIYLYPHILRICLVSHILISLISFLDWYTGPVSLRLSFLSAFPHFLSSLCNVCEKCGAVRQVYSLRGVAEFHVRFL